MKTLRAVGVLFGCAVAATGNAEWDGPIHHAESHLRRMIHGEDGPEEIYALLTEGYSTLGQRYVLVFQHRIVLHCEDGNGRTRERDLTETELSDLRNWLSNNRVDRLSGFNEYAADGIQYEYFHLSRTGFEHRVFMNNPPSTPDGGDAVFFAGIKRNPKRELYGELTNRLLKLDQVPMNVIYKSLKSVPGFHVVHEREKGPIAALSHTGSELIASVWSDKETRSVWYKVTDSGVSTKPLLEEINRQDAHELDGYLSSVPISDGPLKGRRLLVDWDTKGQEGLWIASDGKQPELLAKGVYSRQPVICPGGEWIVAAKTQEGKMWSVPNGIVRIHVPTKRIFSVDLPPADNFDPITWVDAHKRVLLYRQRDQQQWKAGPKEPEFHLLDPATGAHEKVEGEMRPFFDHAMHELQPTGEPNELWAALHPTPGYPLIESSTIGRFDSYDFKFKPMLAFPNITFESRNFFVDQHSKIIWVNVNGDLLRLSLPD